MNQPDPDIEMSRRLRAAMGLEAPAGSCLDCGGQGVVPDTNEDAAPVWRDCPTCKGTGIGGRA